ncbi:centrosomal protein of 44 kDa isoform X1 [Canis lupus baileyi]|uniref:centrosomal protein of 44 kDa isoform X11 n=1 Tax=Canis lupus familiaris TaxID=9615 RepID=UPI0015F1A6D8|nr:centrosomal protein of 44 kDa isoform X11 [Canis lupus familiaris]XP_022265760.2 centrosomal protein of 44 kDa isoform X11 [Canis lupus familiaris]XP_022265762.2 centrosomal protein of 44 kDa isoform X11 [Canis lupus familiaris]XP_035577395.1 centrosomal protein of 44 kDa isoform X1 [Canis lupus dingo]XP_035577399.1 centrosomal protein of 44 kDa isoform X1 [Canis lupus dingo]XP_035577405.1 centrosomal protein of 44 kDa isoform X1 [Canis lupus dingo]XP_038314714.1 centrosomal protein of 44 
MATGDLKRSLRNLEQVLRMLNYPQEVDCVGLVKGDTAASLPIISYSLTSYSPYIAELLMESNIELIAKNDLRFVDTVYKLLRDQFNYKPILTKKQFLQCGFAEWKIQIICDILNCVMKKHKELSSLEKIPSQQRKKISSIKSEPLSTEKTSTESVGMDSTGRFITSGKKKAVVIRHLYNEDGLNIPEDTISTVTDVREAFDVCDLKTTEIKVPEVKFLEIKSEQQDIRINPEITALQTMLTECQEKLQKLALVESRLESLEEKMKGKVMVNEKTWTNLLSRVTLLETEMLLSKKNNEYIDFSELNEDYESSNDIDILNPDRKSKERQTSIPLSSGYSTVSSDSTPRTSSTSYCGLKENSEIQREREAETQAEGEAGSMHREPDVGFDPGSPGSRPGPKAGAKLLRHPGIPRIKILK